jgi:putative inorganic carbon (HCO3(-)) transporter
MTNVLTKILKINIYLLIFLLPNFFLPFSLEVYGFNKQYLLFFLISSAFLVWMARMIICDKEIKFRRTPLDIPVLVFMFFSVLSTVFSVDKVSSLFGFYGRFSDNLVVILSLGIFYFLITNNTQINTEKTTEKHKLSISGMIRMFLWSVFFILIFSYFSIFGIWQMLSKFIAGFQPLGRMFNPIGGGLEGLAMFLAIAVVLLIGLLLQAQNVKSKVQKFSIVSLLLASIVLLIIIDFTAAWVVLSIVLFLFLIFAFWSRIFQERVNWLLIPIFLFIISIFFIFFQISNYKLQISGSNILDHQREILLDQKTTWRVSWEAIKHYPVLGSGIGTFALDFSKFKPQSFNQTDLWQRRFDKGGNQIAEYLSTMGILGFLSWLVMVGMFLLVSWLFLQMKVVKIKTQSEKTQSTINNYQSPLFFTFLTLFLIQFVYYNNTTLAFIFWLVLGLLVVSWGSPTGGAVKEKNISFRNFPEAGLIFNIVLILVSLIILGSWFFAGRFYLADVNFREGILFGKIENLEKAVSLNQLRANYRIILSRNYFIGALDELKKPIEEQNTQKIQTYFFKSIDEAKKAVVLSPNWVVTSENLGMIYRDIQSLVQGANQFAIDSFQKAGELEPINPVFPTEIGKLLLGEGKTEEARKEIEKALELKPDYIDAKIQLAIIIEQEGNFQEAINKLESLVTENPQSVEAIFQLGRVYYNNNQTDKAISLFQQALSLFPNHSNSLYTLGLAYQKEGKIAEALKMFERVLELNPGNQDVIAKIEQLKGPTPSPSPTPTP